MLLESPNRLASDGLSIRSWLLLQKGITAVSVRGEFTVAKMGGGGWAETCAED